ncbi:MAG: type III secretion system export apparatus subunit SctT [Pseudomonadota bacterium]
MDWSSTTQYLLAFLCYMVRIFAIFRTMPIMGTTVIPQQALLSLIAVLLLPIFAAHINSIPSELSFTLDLALLLIKEVFIGIFLGFVFSLLFWTAQSVGYLIDNQRGASQAVGTDPLSGDQLSPYASLLFQSVAMLFFTSGAFLVLLDIIYESYRIWPVFSPTPQIISHEMLDFFIIKAGQYMSVVLSLAAPMLMMCFLTDFSLGIINRFAQQLNVFALSMPIKSAVVLFILFLYAQGMFSEFRLYVQDLGSTFAVLRGIGHE